MLIGQIEDDSRAMKKTSSKVSIDSSKKPSLPDRLSFHSKTSDVHGHHTKNDLDSILSLIRRKVQERCGSITKLMKTIRGFKIGDSKYVTPNEFHRTLMKFGIYLSQSVVDAVFIVFDSDRSGSMDFDEFSLWIMAGEYNQATATVGKTGPENPLSEESVRKSVLETLTNFPSIFSHMRKERIGFLEFSSMLKPEMPMTESQARAMYNLLDPYNTGVLHTKEISAFARGDKGGHIVPPSALLTQKMPLSLAIRQVCGIYSAHLLAGCFDHVTAGEKLKVNFHEFERCLVRHGMGSNRRHTEDLFNALGGSENGFADINVLLSALSLNSQSFAALGFDRGVATEAGEKEKHVSFVRRTRAARMVRETLRKSFAKVRAAIIAYDKGDTGYIRAEDLHAALSVSSGPLSFQDFRYLLQQVSKEDGGSKVNWHSFLNIYNPTRSPHLLAESLAASYSIRENQLRSLNFHEPKVDNTARLVHGKVVQLKTEEEPVLNRTSPDPAETTETLKSVSLSASAPELSAVKINQAFAPQFLNPKLWKSALSACRKSDTSSSGFLSEKLFTEHLESASPQKPLTDSAILELISLNKNKGRVDYVSFFRHLLSSASSPVDLVALEQSSRQHVASQKQIVRSAGPTHPWDFEYMRTRGGSPYWRQATKTVRRLADLDTTKLRLLPPMQKSVSTLSEAEKKALTDQYPTNVLEACSRAYAVMLPQWKQLRNDLHAAQIVGQRGSVTTDKFKNILEVAGISISKRDLQQIVKNFSASRQQEMIKYDEFLRVCRVVKTGYKE